MWYCSSHCNSVAQELRVNYRIRVPQIKLIDETGQLVGVIATPEALRMAREKDLDLVEISPNTQPPIAKIMDYGKYRYEKDRLEKASGGKARPKSQETKAVRVGFKTGAHDLEFKAKKADDFLHKGYGVKVELTLRGREKAFAEKGREKLLAFIQTLTIPFIIQANPTRSPYGWTMMIQKDRKTTAPKPMTPHASHQN